MKLIQTTAGWMKSGLDHNYILRYQYGKLEIEGIKPVNLIVYHSLSIRVTR